MSDLTDGAPVPPIESEQKVLRMRASDADRQATVQVLQDAIARGLLTATEGSDRMNAAYATLHVQDLPALTADLPSIPGGVEPRGWRPLLLLVLEQLRSTLHSAVTERRPAQRGAALLLVLVLLTFGLAFAHLVMDSGSGAGHGGSSHGGPGRR